MTINPFIRSAVEFQDALWKLTAIARESDSKKSSPASYIIPARIAGVRIRKNLSRRDTCTSVD
jgi:hypothetical protein